MKRSMSLPTVGSVIALWIGVHAIAWADDASTLIADRGQAWQQGRSKDIVDRFDEALRLAPKDYRIRKAYGDFLTASRRNEEALAAYRGTVELGPDALDSLGHLELAGSYGGAGPGYS